MPSYVWVFITTVINSFSVFLPRIYLHQDDTLRQSNGTCTIRHAQQLWVCTNGVSLHLELGRCKRAATHAGIDGFIAVFTERTRWFCDDLKQQSQWTTRIPTK